MKARVLVVLLAVSIVLTGTITAAIAPAAAAPRISVDVECCPLVIDIVRTPLRRSSTAKFRAQGIAYVENSQVVLEFPAGTTGPKGGFVVDENTRITPEAAKALGLPSGVFLRKGVFPFGALINRPEGVLARTTSGGIELTVGVKFTWGKK